MNGKRVWALCMLWYAFGFTVGKGHPWDYVVLGATLLVGVFLMPSLKGDEK